MAEQSLYVDSDTPLSVLNYTDEVLGKFAEVGIKTIYDLGHPTLQQVSRLNDPEDLYVPGACYEIRRAQFLHRRCGVIRLGYDGELCG
jgi:hypothetical protein